MMLYLIVFNVVMLSALVGGLILFGFKLKKNLIEGLETINRAARGQESIGTRYATCTKCGDFNEYHIIDEQHVCPWCIKEALSGYTPSIRAEEAPS